jgi:hypothetical protein
MKILIPAMAVLLAGAAAFANEKTHSHQSKYAGEESRAIKSLSPEDIVELRRGGGWGLAKAAELNGLPGPAHLLDLKDEIPLSAAQVAEIRTIHGAMKAMAIRQGNALIELERKLENGFRHATITDAQLRASLHDIANARENLRYIHLATHLKTPKILTRDQVNKYNRLRGYTAPGPCTDPPKGHDAKMWRRHNGCN